MVGIFKINYNPFVYCGSYIIILDMWITQVIGIFYFLFRIYVNEFKTKNILKQERRYFSRFAAYYLGIAMIFDWQLISLNMIITTTSITFIIISILTDFRALIAPTRYYPNFQPEEYFWMKMERITLHWPLIGVGLWMIFSDFYKFVNTSHGIFPLIGVAILFYVPFFCWDERIRKKVGWPIGGWILFSSYCQLSVILLILVQIGF